MNSLSSIVSSVVKGLSGDEGFRKAMRAADVQSKWKAAVERVYGNAAPLVLSHVNGVCILSDDGASTLVVYADDSLVRSDLDARQEFLKLSLRASGERVEAFRIVASRFGMKDRRPFAGAAPAASNPFEKAARTPLSRRRREEVSRIASAVENDGVRRALEAAMIAELECHEEK